MDSSSKKWVIIFLLSFLGMQLITSSIKQEDIKTIPWYEFTESVTKGTATDISVAENSLSLEAKIGDEMVQTVAPSREIFAHFFNNNGIKLKVKEQTGFQKLVYFLVAMLPMLVIMGFLYLMTARQMGFGKKSFREKIFMPGEIKTRFSDVAGVDHIKPDLAQTLDILKSPEKYEHIGSENHRGLLFVGPPGTGKTLLARAIAGEAGVPFIALSGSDFEEMFVGVGAARIRHLFKMARKFGKCIIFIDEIDTIGANRANGMMHSEKSNTLNQFLVELDGFDQKNPGVIVIGATNRPDVLDPALLRRLKKTVTISLPDLAGRVETLKVYLKRHPLALDVDPEVIARGTPGFSGDDLRNLVNEASLIAAGDNRKEVNFQDFEKAKDKILMGEERRTLAMTDHERRITAYHEAGHALMALLEPESDPVHKATIIPRGRALGVVIRLPERDSVSLSKAKILANISIATAGRVAEQIKFGADHITTGAESDIQMVTEYARNMVTRWGMGNVGFVAYSKANGGFLGGAGQSANYSESYAKRIDENVHSIISERYEYTVKMIESHMEEFEALAQALIEKETLTGAEMKAILEDVKSKKMESDNA